MSYMVGKDGLIEGQPIKLSEESKKGVYGVFCVLISTKNKKVNCHRKVKNIL